MKVTIQFGAAVPTLKEQLTGFVIDKKDLDHLQRDCNALVRLHIRGIFGDAAVSTARNKLFKKIMSAIKGTKEEAA